ncbi:MAG: hypothetical protein DWI29_05375 [Planctomycetota bacterium]|nr:MAG: hypothetical protein DWI29_05375 [Planctomycetota bacterium]
MTWIMLSCGQKRHSTLSFLTTLCATGFASVFQINLSVCQVKENALAEPVAHENFSFNGRRT